MAGYGVRGVDCVGHPGGANLVAKGYGFILRYYSPDPAKNLTLQEVADYHRHGLGICIGYEDTGNRALTGTAGGVIDANRAISEAKATGQPTATAIYMAVDFDPITTTAISLTDAYVKASAATLRENSYRAGAYGPLGLIERWLGSGWIDYGFAAAAWQHGHTPVLTHIVQQLGQDSVGGVTVDVDIARTPYFGQWMGAAMRLIRLDATGEIDITDGVTRRHLTPDEYGFWKSVIGDFFSCPQTVWDATPAYTPALPFPTHLTGTLA